MRQNLRSRLIPAALAGVLLMVTACGDDSGPTTPGTSDPAPAVPARVEIRPGAALVPGVGSSMALSAVVYDAAGVEIDTTVVWQSRAPGVAGVSAGGLLTGAAIGSTQVTASVGSVVSPPVLALVAEPAPDVMLIPDSLIASDPDPVDPAAEVGPGWEYRIRILSDAPAVGTRVLGTGARPLAGAVTAVTPQGGETELTVVFVPLNQLFDNLVIDEAIPLVELEEAQGAAPPLLRAPVPPAIPVRVEGSTEFSKGPFKCTATGTVPDLDLPEPKLEITSQLTLLLGYDNALTSLVVEGSVNADFEYKPVFKAVFTGKVSCEALLRTFTVPLNGFLSYFVGIQVPVGIGMELNGKLELAEVGFEVTSTAGASATLGLLCPNGDGVCTALTEFETNDDFSFKPILPDLEDQFKLELGGYGFVFAKPSIGSAFSSATQWEFLAASAGLEQTFDVATAKRQAQDTAYASGFRLIGKVDVGPGADLTKAMDKLKDWLGQELTPDLTLVERRDTLARSPGGSFTIAPERVAPGDTTALGELAKFRVELDPVTYLGLESVEKVEFRWRKETEGSTDFTLENARPTCQEVQGGSGKTIFECETDFLEEHTGTQTFHAFVHAKLFGITLPIPLEVAAHAQASATVGLDQCGTPPEWAAPSIVDESGPLFGNVTEGSPWGLIGPNIGHTAISGGAWTIAPASASWSTSVLLDAKATDYVKMIALEPVASQYLTARIQGTGFAQAVVSENNCCGRYGDADAGVSANAYGPWWSFGAGAAAGASWSGDLGSEARMDVAEVREVQVRLATSPDDWYEAETSLRGNVRHRGEGNRSDINASMAVTFLDVVDAEGNSVPVVICSAAGVSYGASAPAPTAGGGRVVASRPLLQAVPEGR